MSRQKAGKKGILIVLAVTMILGAAGGTYFVRKRWVKQVTTESFSESTKKIVSSDRGFYQLYAVMVDEEQDGNESMLSIMPEDDGYPLELVEINLRNYVDSEISEAGLKYIRGVFSALRDRKKNCIIRFLYDWDGKNIETEPRNIATILRHMEQVAPILNENKDLIYTLQGLFIGNWGEMNNSRYLTDNAITTLAMKLAAVTDREIRLAVRTPRHWRIITDKVKDLENRLGLYNDGMLGSFDDVGTYGDVEGYDSHSDVIRENYLNAWKRSDEISFQDDICKRVLNGGECIQSNELNDLAAAAQDLSRMHVSYLNRFYDLGVMDKWAATTVNDGSVWDGMDGLTYMERHLGYRYLITKATANYHFWSNKVSVEASIRNAGFAPTYDRYQAVIRLTDEEGTLVAETEQDLKLSDLAGMNEDATLKVAAEFAVSEIPPQNLKIWLKITDAEEENGLELANDNKPGEHGYLLGSVSGQ